MRNKSKKKLNKKKIRQYINERKRERLKSDIMLNALFYLFKIFILKVAAHSMPFSSPPVSKARP